MPDFVEVTRRDGDHVVRTRASAEHGKWTVRARGDERGLVEQTLVAPKALLLPATLTFGWPLYDPAGGPPASDDFLTRLLSECPVGRHLSHLGSTLPFPRRQGRLASR